MNNVRLTRVSDPFNGTIQLTDQILNWILDDNNHERVEKDLNAFLDALGLQFLATIAMMNGKKPPKDLREIGSIVSRFKDETMDYVQTLEDKK